MAKEKRVKFTPEELATISAALYGYGVDLIAAMEKNGDASPEFFRERIMHLRAKILMQLEDARYQKQVLTAPRFDLIVAEIVKWQANHVWLPETFVQFIQTTKGWEAEVWSRANNEEKEHGSNTNQNTDV